MCHLKQEVSLTYFMQFARQDSVECNLFLKLVELVMRLFDNLVFGFEGVIEFENLKPVKIISFYAFEG